MASRQVTTTPSARREHDSFVGRDPYLALDDRPHVHTGDAGRRPRRRRRLRPSRTVLGVVAGATVLVGSVSIYGFSGPWSPESAVRLYTGALYLEDFERAWDLVCRRDQEAYGSSFQFTVRNAPVDAPHPHVLVDGAPRWDEMGGGWIVPVHESESPDQRRRYFVVEERGDFRVCSLP